LALPVRNVSSPGYYEDARVKTDVRAMSVATALFFMVGFLTCLNDIVIPHLKSIFELNYTEAILVQFAFFSSYFIFSYPGGKLVDKIGYKKAMVVGLFVMAAGAAGFLPAAYFALFPIFLGALIVLAAGMTVVQVAVNPYVTVIGPAATASSRLNLAQAFNSVGTFIAPFLGGLLILGGATQLTPERMHSLSAAALQSYRELQAHTVTLPYIVITVTLVLLAIALAAIKLKPQVGQTDLTQDFRPGAFAEALSRKPATIWQKPWLIFGALGIFTYVGAEVAIGSFLVNYMGLPQIGGLKESTAANYLMVYWGGAMVGRFIGSAILQRVRTGPVLGGAAIGAFLLVVTSILTHGHTAMFALLAVGLFNSIMFPSIFTLGIQDLGPLTSKGSSLMIAAILGGAILPELTGYLADHIGLQASFLVPAICYIYITIFGLAAIRRPAGSDAILMSDPAA
jgi:FHS family L-fucose permease-like MFS transporter